MLVSEDVDGIVQVSLGFFVDSLHEHECDILMAHIVYQRAFQNMGKWAMSQVMEHHGRLYSLSIVFANVSTFVAKGVDGLASQMVGADGMLQSGMSASWVYIVCWP